MTKMEMKKNRKSEMDKRFSEKFSKMKERSDAFIGIRDEEQVYFRIDVFPDEYALVIEYAENKAKAIRGIFGEDGDLFYLDEMDEDEMFEAMLEEVRGTY